MSIIVSGPPGAAPGLYGDGNQSGVTFDGTSVVAGLTPAANVYTMVADIHTGALTNNVASTIKPQGFIIHVDGDLNNAGSINSDGLPAVASVAGAAIAATGTLQTVGGAGGAGRNTTGAGSAATGAGGRNVSGSGGGAGGTGGGPNTGGAGNTTAFPTAIQGTARSLQMVMRGRLKDNTSFNGSGGGGGGGVTLNTGTAISGGGGSAAVAMIIFCRRLNNTGTISCKGGAGANATGTGDANGGGGGGGAGGYLAIVTQEIISLGTVSVDGGIQGTGFGLGANGVPGTKGLGLIFLPNSTIIL